MQTILFKGTTIEVLFNDADQLLEITYLGSLTQSEEFRQTNAT
ncbi:MAG: hypothetical protein RMJ87_10675 [Cytophagales bacterium]|nr:hypothetical protein [Bernardetiaceae bacterium]MDW8205483.1 hypothetical protein [Cytophagales bacterium]